MLSPQNADPKNNKIIIGDFFHSNTHLPTHTRLSRSDHTKGPARSFLHEVVPSPHDIVLHEVTASRTPLVSAYYFEILMSKEKSIRKVRFKLDFKFEVNRKIFPKVLFMLFVYLLFPLFLGYFHYIL